MKEQPSAVGRQHNTRWADHTCLPDGARPSCQARTRDRGGQARRRRRARSEVVKLLIVVEQLMREAVAFHLDGMREDGLSVPPPDTYATYVEVAA